MANVILYNSITVIRGRDNTQQARVITIALNKGGTAKTTTIQALMAGLTAKGFKVLAIDLDGQGNLSVTTGSKRSGKTIYDVLMNRENINKVIQKTKFGDVIASSPDLANLDAVMGNMTGREFKLKEAMKKLKAEYDFILIDTPPALGVEISNALTASDYVILTAQPNSFSIDGIDMIFKAVIVPVREYMNRDLKILGILLTRCKKRTGLYQESRKEFKKMADEVGTVLFDTAISDSVHIQEIQSYSMDFYNNSANTAIKDYREFVDEFLQKIDGGEE